MNTTNFCAKSTASGTLGSSGSGGRGSGRGNRGGCGRQGGHGHYYQKVSSFKQIDLVSI